MIKLIGVISRGGIPIRVKTLINIEAEELLAGMVEAIKALSTVIGKKVVRMLDFGKDKLLFTESNKGYTIIALVDKAEDYVERLLEVIADDIDSSPVDIATGLVSDELRGIIDEIINTYTTDSLKVSIFDVVGYVWEPILKALEKDDSMRRIFEEANRYLSEALGDNKLWKKFKGKVKTSFQNAINYALAGDFDHACAASIDIDDDLVRVFAVKMGLLALRMTNSITPSLDELEKVLDAVYSDDPFYNLVRQEIKLFKGEISRFEYLEAFRIAAEQFVKLRDEWQLPMAFLFLGPYLGNLPEFAQGLADFFMAKSDVIYTYILAILDRNKIFSKIYSATRYEEFRDDLALWRRKINDILRDMDKFIKLGSLKKFFGMMPKGAEVNKLGITYSLNLQTYMALLTALAESPILPIPERRQILLEVLNLYNKYVRDLIRSNISLFSDTIINIFQSISVVLSELNVFLTRDKTGEHIESMIEFLRDVINITVKEFIKKNIDTQLNLVVTNAICPALSKSGKLYNEEILLLYLTLKTINTKAIEEIKILRPYGFAVTVGNLLNTLASILHRLKLEDSTELITRCVHYLVSINKWFLTHGVICRDDIASITYNISRLLSKISDDVAPEIIKFVIAQNKIAILDIQKYDYEAAILSDNYISFLIEAWRKTSNTQYIKDAKEIFNIARAAWEKYGFQEKASELANTYIDILERA